MKKVKYGSVKPPRKPPKVGEALVWTDKDLEKVVK